jgi:hypothetical protein
MTNNDDGTDEDKALRALHALIDEGGWQPTYGGPSMQIYIRAWPDNSADNLMFNDLRTAYAERVNPDGDPVWQLTGTVAEAVAALRALPKPDAPDAPHTVLPRRDATDRDM